MNVETRDDVPSLPSIVPYGKEYICDGDGNIAFVPEVLSAREPAINKSKVELCQLFYHVWLQAE